MADAKQPPEASILAARKFIGGLPMKPPRTTPPARKTFQAPFFPIRSALAVILTELIFILQHDFDVLWERDEEFEEIFDLVENEDSFVCVLIDEVESGARIVQPRLRHRYQVDRHGLSHSRHRLVGAEDDVEIEFGTTGSDLAQVLGAIYALERLEPASRRAIGPVLLKAIRWRGPIGRRWRPGSWTFCGNRWAST